MQTFDQPDDLTLLEVLQRPYLDSTKITKSVISILERVKQTGDRALIEFAQEFDKVQLDQLIATPDEIKKAISMISDELKDAIDIARKNIEKFHASQRQPESKLETSPGIFCW